MSMGDLIVGFVMLGMAALIIGGLIGLIQLTIALYRKHQKLDAIIMARLQKTESTTTTMPDTRAYLEAVNGSRD